MEITQVCASKSNKRVLALTFLFDTAINIATKRIISGRQQGVSRWDTSADVNYNDSHDANCTTDGAVVVFRNAAFLPGKAFSNL